MLGDSFCKFSPPPRNTHILRVLSIPMLGDSFCKEELQRRIAEEAGTFNPHAWGLFLQARSLPLPSASGKALSIPMLGDSFCKLTVIAGGKLLKVAFQSPCLGTLFASFGWVNEKSIRNYLSIPMLGDSFCKYLSRRISSRCLISFQLSLIHI